MACMPTTLRPPDKPRPLWTDHAGAPPPPPPPRSASPPTARGRRRAPLALLLATTALLGGGAGAGALAATGVLDGQAGNSTTTVLQRDGAPTTISNGTGGGLDAKALYASASPGVVDISAKGASSATGTGFVVDADGHIVTAAHVVEEASSITVKLAGGTTRAATVLGRDEATDVAVLKIDPSG